MSLANERITISPLEESLTNIPLELNGVTRGMGIQIAQQGSVWTPAATETPQLAQSADTEGGLNIATTIGLRSSPVLKFGIVEPLDPAGTNYVLNPQCVSTGTAFSQAQATGATSNPLVRDLIGYDYALLQVNPGTNAGEGLSAPMGTPSAASGSLTAGVWLKGANGGEAVQLSLNANGTPVTSNVTLTSSWQWYTVSSTWSSTSLTFEVVGQGSTALAFYSTGWSAVNGPSLLNGFDGTTPGCSWAGLPHASTSTRPPAGGARMTAIMGDLEQQVKLLSQYGGTIRRMLPTQTGTTFRITYDVVNAQLSWDDTEYALTGVSQGTITFMCQPYGRGPEMTTVTDSFNPLVASNYVVDSGALSNFTWGSSGLVAASNLSTHNRFLCQASEYPLYSGEVQATFTPGATVTGFAGGVILERSNASNYLTAYVTDNGTSSFLKVDKVVAGATTNELSVTLSSRIANGTAYTVRCRVQRQNNADNVYAEYFAATSVPATTGVPTNTLGPYVVTDAVFGAETAGLGGITFTPVSAGAKVTNLIISPYLARERTLPVLRFGLAGVPGTVPGLGRMDITDCSGNSQLWATWGQRHSRLGAAAATTDMFYEAEAMTPVNAAVIVTGFAGASGSEVVQISSLPAASWVSFLATELVSGSAQLTHTGSYNVWARAYSSTGTPQLQLQWGVGSLSVPTTNAPTTLPATSGFYLVNLGVVQLQTPPQGTMQWFGSVQAYSTLGGDNVSVDCLYLQPLDDGGAVMEYVPVPPVSEIATGPLVPTTGANVTGVGTLAWNNPGNITLPGKYASTASGPGTTEYLTAEGYGFSIPSGVNIQGIQVNIVRAALTLGSIVDNRVRLIKAGSIQTPDRSMTGLWPQNGYAGDATYGGPSDLWGGTWAASDINNSGFGVALSATISTAVAAGVEGIVITVYYTFATGFLVAQDAVIYAGQVAEIGSSYAWRTPNGTVWGPVGSYTGQYMKVPSPAYYDGTDNVLVKASRNLASGGDTGIDAIQAQVSITPRYSQIPDE